MLSQSFIEEMKQKLISQKQKFEQNLSGLSPRTEMGDDYDENAEEINVDEVSQDTIVLIKSDLEKIDKALAKIEEGTYGIDDEGKEISEDRLRSLPWADKAI